MVDPHALGCLQRAHHELREDFDVLVRCLQALGTVRAPWLHGMKFERMRERFPLGGGGGSLASVLEPGLVCTILQMNGGEREELMAFKETCSACRGLVDKVQAEKLYVFGGVDAWYHRPGNPLRAAEKFSPQTGQWEALPRTSVPRVGSVAGILSGRVYLLGGLGEPDQTIEWFSPRLQRWETTRPAPKLSTARAFAAAVAVHGRLYICGGHDPKEGMVHRSLEVFDPSLARFELLPVTMLMPRADLAAARVPGEEARLFVCGGHDTGYVGHACDTAEALHLTGSGAAWERLPSMTTPRHAHSAVTLEGSIVVCGGSNGVDRNHSSVEHFDWASRSWSPLPSMSVPRAGLCAACVCGQLYVYGGHHFRRAVSSGECFDPSERAWRPLQSKMQQGRMYFCAAVVKVGALAQGADADAGADEKPL